MEEHKLVERMKAGDRCAFDLLYEQYKNQLLRAAYLILGNQSDSEDVVQETFVKCYLSSGELKDVSVFRSWLYTILTRTAWQYGKKKSKEIPDVEVTAKADPNASPSSLEVIMEAEESKIMYQFIHELDVKHRTVIVYYYYNQLSTKEIAKLCGCLEGTVKSRLFHARKLLKEKWIKSEQEDARNENESKSRRKNNPGLVR